MKMMFGKWLCVLVLWQSWEGGWAGKKKAKAPKTEKIWAKRYCALDADGDSRYPWAAPKPSVMAVACGREENVCAYEALIWERMVSMPPGKTGPGPRSSHGDRPAFLLGNWAGCNSLKGCNAARGAGWFGEGGDLWLANKTESYEQSTDENDDAGREDGNWKIPKDMLSIWRLGCTHHTRLARHGVPYYPDDTLIRLGLHQPVCFLLHNHVMRTRQAEKLADDPLDRKPARRILRVFCICFAKDETKPICNYAIHIGGKDNILRDPIKYWQYPSAFTADFAIAQDWRLNKGKCRYGVMEDEEKTVPEVVQVMKKAGFNKGWSGEVDCLFSCCAMIVNPYFQTDVRLCADWCVPQSYTRADWVCTHKAIDTFRLRGSDPAGRAFFRGPYADFLKMFCSKQQEQQDETTRSMCDSQKATHYLICYCTGDYCNKGRPDIWEKNVEVLIERNIPIYDPNDGDGLGAWSPMLNLDEPGLGASDIFYRPDEDSYDQAVERINPEGRVVHDSAYFDGDPCQNKAAAARKARLPPPPSAAALASPASPSLAILLLFL